MAIQIGESLPRSDALNKVLGHEKYACDLYSSNMFFAGVKRAGIAYGELISINTEKAKALNGVISVLTAKDVPGTNRAGIVVKDQPVLVEDKILHMGDAVALVVAKDQKTLKKALDLITLEIKPLKGVFDPISALKPDAPLLHPDLSKDNCQLQGNLTTGEGLKAFDKCETQVTGTFMVPFQEHAYLETENGVACLEKDGSLTMTVSTQAPFRDRFEIAHALDLDMEKIRVKTVAIGGAFGGKDGATVQCLLALAALNSQNRPVMMVWDRKESFIAGTKRLAGQLKYRLGCDSYGRLLALECHIYMDSGAYANLGGEVLGQCMEASGGPYRIPNAVIKGKACYTNNPIAGPFRGFGAPQAAFAIEQMMDMLAEKMGQDPLEFRLKNALETGDKNSVGTTLMTSTGVAPCLLKLKEQKLWQKAQEWKAKARPFKKRGAGLSMVMHSVGFGPKVPDYAQAKIVLTEKGGFKVYSGIVDMGQGNAPSYLQIAGNVLNQDLENLDLILPDTGQCLPSGSASASRCTYIFGNALIEAAENLKQSICEQASLLLSKEDGGKAFALIKKKLRHLPSGQELDLDFIAGFMNQEQRTSVGFFRAPVAKDAELLAHAMEGHCLGHGLFSYAAHLALIEVDELTGKIKVCKYLSVTDCGRIINPGLFEQQVQGGIVQGIGYALLEDFKVQQGITMTEDFSTYILPTALDAPDIKSLAVQTHEETGPFGLKGVGELPICGPLPAIANGLYDSLRIRLFSAPLTGEKVLLALAAQKKEQ